MLKKCISSITLAAFIVFSLSCGTKQVGLEKMAAWEGKKVKILSVTKTSGEIVEFSKESPVRIRGNAIVGTGRVIREKELIEINSSDVKTKDPMNRQGTEIVTKDGKKYILIAYRPDEGKYTVTVRELYESISIPLLEVREIAILNRGKGALRGLGIGALVGALFGASILSLTALTTDESSTEWDPAFAALIGGYGGVLFGTPLGLIYGASKGATYKYIITAPTDSTSTIKK